MSLLLALPFTVMAQQKIAVVNSQEIMQALPDTKAADATLQKLAKESEADIKLMSDELDKQVKAFMAEREKISEVSRQRREEEIRERQGRIQRSYQMLQEQLRQKESELLAPIQAKILAAIKKVADSNGITYVMESAAMLTMGADALDITAKVKTELGIKETTTTPAPKGKK